MISAQKPHWKQRLENNLLTCRDVAKLRHAGNLTCDLVSRKAVLITNPAKIQVADTKLMSQVLKSYRSTRHCAKGKPSSARLHGRWFIRVNPHSSISPRPWEPFDSSPQLPFARLFFHASSVSFHRSPPRAIALFLQKGCVMYLLPCGP